jgi:hypothetical protein
VCAYDNQGWRVRALGRAWRVPAPCWPARLAPSSLAHPPRAPHRPHPPPHTAPRPARQLLALLLRLLHEGSAPARREVMRVLGIIGALDPHTHKVEGGLLGWGLVGGRGRRGPGGVESGGRGRAAESAS